MIEFDKDTTDLGWVLDDEYGAYDALLSTPVGSVHAWITTRPFYCDRGHYLLQVEGNLELDAQDRFPRYFMSLETAQHEFLLWLRWRIFKIPNVQNMREDAIRRASK